MTTLKDVWNWHRRMAGVNALNPKKLDVMRKHGAMADAIEPYLAAQGQGEPQHPDDIAVDAFAAAMRAKLAAARARGRGGWRDKSDCPQQRLSDMLHAHVAKGDPRDVANFCMFLHQRGEAILPASPAGVPDVAAMVNRFLGWSLPKDFAPDAGISFNPGPTQHLPHCWPVGTNLFTAAQATAMVEYMLAAPQPGEPNIEDDRNG